MLFLFFYLHWAFIIVFFPVTFCVKLDYLFEISLVSQSKHIMLLIFLLRLLSLCLTAFCFLCHIFICFKIFFFGFQEHPDQVISKIVSLGVTGHLLYKVILPRMGVIADQPNTYRQTERGNLICAPNEIKREIFRKSAK